MYFILARGLVTNQLLVCIFIFIRRDCTTRQLCKILQDMCRNCMCTIFDRRIETAQNAFKADKPFYFRATRVTIQYHYSLAYN